MRGAFARGVEWAATGSVAPAAPQPQTAKVRLLVESLDPAGKPVASEIAYVDSEVPLYNRSYFEVRPLVPAPTYRVTVYSADWGKMGGL